MLRPEGQRLTQKDIVFAAIACVEKERFRMHENICPHLGAKLSNGWICEKTNTISIMVPYCSVRTHPKFDVFSVYLLSNNSKIMVGSAHPTNKLNRTLVGWTGKPAQAM